MGLRVFGKKELKNIPKLRVVFFFFPPLFSFYVTRVYLLLFLLRFLIITSFFIPIYYLSVIVVVLLVLLFLLLSCYYVIMSFPYHVPSLVPLPRWHWLHSLQRGTIKTLWGRERAMSDSDSSSGVSKLWCYYFFLSYACKSYKYVPGTVQVLFTYCFQV